MFQTKEHDKTEEKDLNEMKINNLPEKEFKVMIVKMLRELWRRMMNAVRTLTKSQEILKRKAKHS